MSPRTLFRAAAFAEVVTWTLLIIGMVLKYVTRTTDLGVRIGGGIHGFVFLTFVVVVLFSAVNHRWPARTTLVTLLAAVIPYATIAAEQRLDRQGRLDGGWRLRTGGDEPAGRLERLQAWMLRHLLLAVGVAAVFVVVVFAVLLSLGPPTQWFS